jgi:low temperature requirement protein LtrA
VWAAGLFVELLGSILAVRTLSNPRVSFHPRHIAERYGLFTIIVLGESVLAVALGTADTDWRPSAVLTAMFGSVVAACVWWLYFDHVGSEGIELGPRPSFYWGYGHLAVYAGIAAFGVGTQLAIEAAAAPELALAAAAPAGSYDLGARLALAGGVALYLAGIAFVDRINEGVAGGRTVLVRLATSSLLVVLAIIGSPLPPPLFVALVAIVVLALTVVESLHEDASSRVSA